MEQEACNKNSPDFHALGKTLKILGEPVRLRILDRLTGGSLCACDLLRFLEIPQSTLSHYMKILVGAVG